MLKVTDLTFGYFDTPVLYRLNFSIEPGQNVSLVGESGSGKSTLLECIYGLHHVSGTIHWKNRRLLGPRYNLVPGESMMKYLSQDFNLMPSISARENIGKFLSNAFPRKKKKRIDQLLKLVDMEAHGDTRAGLLSGGQQQRIALARVLADPPEVLLLDEPFSHIDQFRRNSLRRKLYEFIRQEEITVITATHDSTDALAFAERTFVMKAGKILAEGAPSEVYQHPKNAYVAALFEEVNDLPASLFLPGVGRKRILLYPHEIHLEEKGNVEAKVKRSFFKGPDFLLETQLKNEVVLVRSSTEIAAGKSVRLHVAPDLLNSRLK